MEDPISILPIASLREKYPNTKFFLVRTSVFGHFSPSAKSFLANITFGTEHVD